MTYIFIIYNKNLKYLNKFEKNKNMSIFDTFLFLISYFKYFIHRLTL